MNLDRALIKSQARGLIKNNVFKFFVLIFVVLLLTGSGSIYTSVTGIVNDAADKVSDRNNNYGLNDMDEYDFDDFVEGYGNQDNMEEFSLDDFAREFEKEYNSQQQQNSQSGNPAIQVVKGGMNVLTSLSSILTLFLAPLSITLVGVFYQLIKGNNLSWNDEFEFVFKNTFNKLYWNKFLLNLLKGLFMVLLCFLFIIPGIVFYYKYYFTSYIMNEKPELSWKEAMNISKKMTNGHKGELFVLDLSFIGWYLLEIITLGIVGIYVLPYVYTTQALYYENFKIRAFQLGIMSQDDYLTEGEKAAIAYNNAQQQGGFYQPAAQGVYPEPAQPNMYQPPVQQNVYQPPVQETYQPPVQENVYQPPVQQEEPQTVDYTYEQAPNPVDTTSEQPTDEE